jgi:hypothetical protein
VRCAVGLGHGAPHDQAERAAPAPGARQLVIWLSPKKESRIPRMPDNIKTKKNNKTKTKQSTNDRNPWEPRIDNTTRTWCKKVPCCWWASSICKQQK